MEGEEERRLQETGKDGERLIEGWREGKGGMTRAERRRKGYRNEGYGGWKGRGTRQAITGNREGR